MYAALLALVILMGTVVGTVSAATRLGLNVTQQELDIWRTRMTDNVNTINGFTYQSIYQNRIKAQADAFLSTQSGDGIWAGNTTATCQPPESFGFGPGRASGQYMAVSAFVFLLTGNTTYAAGVRTNLLTLAGNPNLDFTNATKWCTPGYQNSVEIQSWAIKMIFAYDYLKTGNYSGLSSGERTTLETWLKGLANWFYEKGMRTPSLGGFYSYNLFSNPLNTACLSNCTASGAAWYFGGHATATASENIFNTSGTGGILLGLLAGMLTNDATMIADVKRWITGYIPTAHNNIGGVAQFRRWQDGACAPTCGVGSAWGHAGGMTGSIIQAVDVLARTGDTALYTVSASNQVPGSPAGTVSLFLHLRKWARMTNSTEPLYSYSGSTQNTEITWDADPDPYGRYEDFFLLAANLFYQDSEISTATNRLTKSGTNSAAQGVGCYDAQFGGCFSGTIGAWWPDLPFMYGNLPGVVNPYSVAAAGDPVVTITAPTSGATVSIGTTPLTTLAGTATDDVDITSITWSCPGCLGAPSGTATCTPSCGGAGNTSVTWTVASIPLTPGSGNVITVSVSDGTVTTTDTLTVTLTGGPVARYLFEGNANDSTGNGHTGILQNGATATAPGQTGLGLTLDGVNDYVSITSATDLNIVGDITIAFWANLATAGQGDVIVSKEGITPDYNEPYHVEVANSGVPHYAWYHNSNNDFSTYKEFTAYTVPLNTWHRVVVTRTQATKDLALYVNGQLQQTLTGWTNDAGSTAQPLFLGANGTLDSTRFLAGRLDDVVIEPRVWALSEIQSDGQLLAPLLLRVVR